MQADRSEAQRAAGEPQGTGPRDEEFDTLGLLEHVSPGHGPDRGAGDDAVQIMTLHAAKGLEFPVVFLPAGRKASSPRSAHGRKGEKGLEEERRLAYVAITRAREKCTITHAANRRIYGQWTSSIPSRFIDELPAEHIENEQTMTGGAACGAPTGAERLPTPSPIWRRPTPHGPANAARAGNARRPAAASMQCPHACRRQASPQWDWEPQGTQRPRCIGHARVSSEIRLWRDCRDIEGNKLEIDFEQAGRKRVIDSFVTIA
jgi:DNA helicase-2/ATP-dependent DNA helicase PcrA